MKKLIDSLAVAAAGLCAVAVVSCKNDDTFEGYEQNAWIYIPGTNVTVKTGPDNWRLVQPLFATEAMAAQRYEWSLEDPSLAILEPQEDNAVKITGLKVGDTMLKIASADGRKVLWSHLFVEKGFTLDNPILIDFGRIPSPAPFINLTNPKNQDKFALTDTEGGETGITIQLTSGFNDLERGIQNNLGLPFEASRDIFFNDGIHVPEATMQLTGLNPRVTYTLVCYGAINDNANCEVIYAAVGKNEVSQPLNVGGSNPDRIAMLVGVRPNDNGEVTLKMGFGPNNNQWARFYGISALAVLPAGFDPGKLFGDK